MHMKGGVRPNTTNAGFTLVETIIVLAVTSALMVAAMGLISGKQASTQFSQGVQEVQSMLQKDMNDVANGYYQNDGKIHCAAGGLGGGPDITVSTTVEGTNQDCVFMGKVIQFAVGGVGDQYNTYTIAGLRGSTADPATTLATANPRLIASSATWGSGVPDVFESASLPYGLTVVNMYYGNNPVTPANQISALAFIPSLSTFSASNNTAQVDAAPVTATPLSLHLAKSTFVDMVDNPASGLASLPAAAINPVNGIHICLKSGGTNQSVLITIGGGGRQGTVTDDVKPNGTCS